MKLTSYTNYGLRSLQLAALKAPEDIVVGDVLRLTEGPLDVVECFNPEKNTCPLIEICTLSRKIQEATRAFMAVLDDLTIADISANRGQLLDRIAPFEFPKAPETLT